MPQQQQLMAVLVLAGLAGVVIFISMRGGPRPPGGEPGPPGIPPLTPEQSTAFSGNGARPVARAVPYYQNEERWELKRDARGHLEEIVVHRDARVTK